MLSSGRDMRYSAPEWVGYECPIRYDWWVRLLIASAVVALLIIGLLMILGVIPVENESERWSGGGVMLGIAVFEVLVFRMVFPTRVRVLQDRVCVRLGGPFAFNIPFDTVDSVERWDSAYNAGLRFAPSLKGRVLFKRRRGRYVLVSVADRDTFIEQVGAAIQEWRRAGAR